VPQSKHATEESKSHGTGYNLLLRIGKIDMPILAGQRDIIIGEAADQERRQIVDNTARGGAVNHGFFGCHRHVRIAANSH